MSSNANLGFVKAALRFAPAVMRTPVWRLSALFLILVLTMIMTLTMSLTAMKLSPNQERDFHLGVADYMTNMPQVPVRGYKKLNLDHLSTLGRTELVAFLPLTGLGATATAHQELRISETPWDSSPYPKRYTLTAGRYPAAPGEIALSTSLARSGSVGGEAQIAVPGVTAHWKITGIIADTYISDNDTVYAAPGTLSNVYRQIEDISGIPQYLTGSFYWSAPSPEPVLQQLKVLNNLSAAVQEQPAAVAAQVLLNAADLHGDHPEFGGNPMIYIWPAVCLPALVMIMAMLLLTAWLRKQQLTLAAMGIQNSALTLAIMGALAIMGLVATMVAAIAALGVGAVVRIIMSQVFELPLSAFMFPWSLVPLFLLSIGGGIITGLAVAGVWARKTQKIAVRKPKPSWVLGGIGGLGFFVLGVLFIFPGRFDDQNQIMGASFVVMVSALMALWLAHTRRLWPDSLAGVLSRRMKERDAFSSAMTSLLCGIIVGIPLMLVTTAVTIENTANLTQLDSVPPHTVRVTMADQLGRIKDIPETLQAQIDAEFPQKPIRIHHVVDQSIPPKISVRTGFDETKTGQIWAFESVADVSRWLGGLRPEQEHALQTGGILSADARDGVIPVHMSSLDGQVQTEMIMAAPVELPREYLIGMNVRSITLQSFATAHELPLAPTFVEYPQLDQDTQTRIAQQKPRFSLVGLNVDVHNELHHLSVPVELQALVLVSTIIMGVWILVLALGIAGRLSKHLDSLFALGVNRRWAGKVLAFSLFPILIPAIITGMVSGYLGVLILKLQPEKTEALPVATSWPTYGFVTLGLTIALVLSFGLAFMRISSEKRK